MAKGTDSFMNSDNSYPGHDAGTDAPTRVDGIPFHSPGVYIDGKSFDDNGPQSINVQRPDAVKGK